MSVSGAEHLSLLLIEILQMSLNKVCLFLEKTEKYKARQTFFTGGPQRVLKFESGSWSRSRWREFLVTTSEGEKHVSCDMLKTCALMSVETEPECSKKNIYIFEAPLYWALIEITLKTLKMMMMKFSFFFLLQINRIYEVGWSRLKSFMGCIRPTCHSLPMPALMC